MNKELPVLMVPVTLKLMSITPHKPSAFASAIAARKVQLPRPSSHTILPGAASVRSPRLLTVNDGGHAGIGAALLAVLTILFEIATTEVISRNIAIVPVIKKIE